MSTSFILWFPIINCGYLAGDYPAFFNEDRAGIGFKTEKECDEWIENHKEDFTCREFSGAIVPMDIECHIDFLEEIYLTLPDYEIMEMNRDVNRLKKFLSQYLNNDWIDKNLQNAKTILKGLVETL